MARPKPDKGTSTPKKGDGNGATSATSTPKNLNADGIGKGRVDRDSAANGHAVASTPKNNNKSKSKSSKSPIKVKVTVSDPAPAEHPLEKTPLWNWLVFIPLLTVVPYLFSKLHYSLPEPLPPYDESGRPQPAEELILGHIQALETIGYRTVGTYEAIAGEEYVLSEVQKLVRKCDEGGNLKCDWWAQKGSGFHAFEILDHEVLKAYVGVANIILQITSIHPPSYNASAPHLDQDAILLGAHIDSTMPSPGAADDGIGAGVMLDVARVLVERNEPFDASIIFLWNGAEDGSHLYSTKHPSAKRVRAMINLEAAGSTGGALLFQATSKEMIDAPRGTVIASDVFQSGIIMSDTDFGQFERYLGVSGLDMAIVGHSYFYHTRRDTLEHIERGSAQHFGSNIMAIVDYLLSPESPLLMREAWSPPDVVYLALYDRLFFQYSMNKADGIYTALAALAAGITLRNLGRRSWKPFLVALIGTPLGMIGGLVSANILAGVLSAVGKGQLWPQLEQAHYYVQLVLSSLYMLLLQALRVRSAYLFAFITGMFLVGAVMNELGRAAGGKKDGIALKSAYYLTTIGFMAFAIEGIPADAPAEHIVATISSACGFVFLPYAPALFHRTSRRTQRKVLLGLVLFLAGALTVMAGPWYFPYDKMHPKRVGVQYNYNHTSGAHTAHIAFMDRGPISDIAPSAHARYGDGSPLEHTSLTDYDSDWDVMYPISSFFDTYRFPVAVDAEARDFQWPKMGHYVQEGKWDYGQREIKLRFDFRGLVWPTLAFEAAVLKWSFNFPPPQHSMRHHIKVATAADEPIMDLNLTLRMEPGETLKIHWSAFDLNQMIPGTASRLGPDMPASKMLLDLDEWATEKWGGHLDMVMSGTVCGVIDV
ncbi:hypothetical protein IAR55_001960 [Kwoniella newhampshirensis]|uniref:Peptide hydrolase n=1 Tax=Kwoniella newhampshirensis TaxID=1651941 RepID=A0AAW0Z3R3_9TREE